ncbi:MAG: alpha-galactosidase, partial [Oscillospiraceae bacterium]
YYTVYFETNVITRHAMLQNNNKESLVIRKFMSMMLDLPSADYTLITFDGGWIKETHKHTRELSYGIYVNESTTGSSSNRHNPGIILSEKNAHEDYGKAYGFNLIYSGNHYEAVEVSNHNLVRVMTGINPHCFYWELKQLEQFETPEAVMTYSKYGLNGVSQNFHSFINQHIVRGEFASQERPVLINNWEASFFDFNLHKLLKLARQAKKLGIELFVLDDGWFGNRNNDKTGLGDYFVNKKKLPHGLNELSKKINKIGLKFGLWFEPEMANEDSELFRQHPEYVVKIPNRNPSLGRNQYVLDLCNINVRDYIVQSVNNVLKSANIEYVKWDMNRHICDAYSPEIKHQGEFFHRYTIGLYDLLKRIVSANSHILFESCSSGGNRFDLGMLCFTPQIWASDNTDPIERLSIQKGLSYLYPLSTIGAHVSLAPHQQTLRQTPLSTRFNVATFGLLGYELDLNYLSFAEKKEVAKQIDFYKKYRNTMQYGTLYRYNSTTSNLINFLCVSPNKTCAILGNFELMAKASPPNQTICLKGLIETDRYSFQTFPQGISIKQFGVLVNHILPFKIMPDGFIVKLINQFYRLPNCVECYSGFGDLMAVGIGLNNEFMGSCYNSNTRLLGDFGSSLYIIEKQKS